VADWAGTGIYSHRIKTIPEFLLVVEIFVALMVVLMLTGALLLKLGKLKPGSFPASETPLGGFLMAIGILGMALNWMQPAFDEPAIVESVPVQILILIMIVGFGVGLWIEWKARKVRKARSEAEN